MIKIYFVGRYKLAQLVQTEFPMFYLEDYLLISRLNSCLDSSFKDLQRLKE